VAGLFSVSKKSVTFLHASKTPHFLRKQVFTKNLAALVKKSVPDIFDGYNLITSGAFFSPRRRFATPRAPLLLYYLSFAA
jgi:hypothetical protein